MVNGIERPLDLLNSCKGKMVEVYLKGREKPVKGKLISFDIHINLVLEESKITKFIRGDIVEIVNPAKEEKKE